MTLKPQTASTARSPTANEPLQPLFRTSELAETPTSNDARNKLDLMSIDEVAAALGKTVKTIRNWAAKRDIPYVPVPGGMMFLRSSVLAWLKKQEVKPWE